MLPVNAPVRTAAPTAPTGAAAASGLRPVPKPPVLRAETARAVEPPPPVAAAQPSDGPAVREILARDPDAPTGPPPSFEANVLDRVRELAALEAHLEADRRAEVREALAEAEPAEADPARADPPAETGRYDTPSTSAQRASQGVADLRRATAPVAGRVDLTR